MTSYVAASLARAVHLVALVGAFACSSKTVNKADPDAGGTGSQCDAAGTPCAECLSSQCCPEVDACRAVPACACAGSCARQCEAESGGLPCYNACVPSVGPAGSAWNDLRSCASSRCSAQCEGAVSVIPQVAAALPDCR